MVGHLARTVEKSPEDSPPERPPASLLPHRHHPTPDAVAMTSSSTSALRFTSRPLGLSGWRGAAAPSPLTGVQTAAHALAGLITGRRHRSGSGSNGWSGPGHGHDDGHRHRHDYGHRRHRGQRSPSRRDPRSPFFPPFLFWKNSFQKTQMLRPIYAKRPREQALLGNSRVSLTTRPMRNDGYGTYPGTPRDKCSPAVGDAGFT